MKSPESMPAEKIPEDTFKAADDYLNAEESYHANLFSLFRKNRPHTAIQRGEVFALQMKVSIEQKNMLKATQDGSLIIGGPNRSAIAGRFHTFTPGMSAEYIGHGYPVEGDRVVTILSQVSFDNGQTETTIFKASYGKPHPQIHGRKHEEYVVALDETDDYIIQASNYKVKPPALRKRNKKR